MPRAKYQCVSCDSHIMVPPERFTDRVPSRFRDFIARTVRMPSGADALVATKGKKVYPGVQIYHEERTPFATIEGTPGTGSPEQRLEEQDVDGVDAEVLFPRSYSFLVKDRDAKNAIIRAYNGFLAEDYCSVAPDRLIGVGEIPETGLDDAIAELEYCAANGIRVAVLKRFPSGRPFPTPEDDRFYEMAMDRGVALTVHVMLRGGTSSPGKARPSATDAGLFQYSVTPDECVKDIVGKYAKTGIFGSVNVVQLILSGVFDRLPELRLFFAETGIGWIPHWLEQLDNRETRDGPWAAKYLGIERRSRPLSEYVKEHIYWGFQLNPVGVRVMRQEVGMDRIMWATDFPHIETDWPNSRSVIEANCATLSSEERHQIIAGNAIEFFRLQE